MEILKPIDYDAEKSMGRIRNAFNADKESFRESPNVPQRSDMTLTNGFYVDITALFIDMVGSSDLADAHQRPILASIYRAFISECIAHMISNHYCKDINIHGDCVWGIFDTHDSTYVDDVYMTAFHLEGLIHTMNGCLEKHQSPGISAGIGIDNGIALMVKAGYCENYLNDVVWMGNVVNKASRLSGIAGRGKNHKIIMTDKVYCKLSKKYREDTRNELHEIKIDNVIGKYYGVTPWYPHK